MALGTAVSFESGKREAVLQELARILDSRYFRNAARSKQFLRYAVEHALENSEPLKERTIGVELFDRRSDYATGDDPVVRVQAGEVRRRLGQYYRDLSAPPRIRIEIPVGSYTPVFNESPDPRLRPVAVELSAGTHSTARVNSRVWPKYIFLALICVALLAAGLVALRLRSSRATQKTAIDEFWQPIFATPQPALVCLYMPTVYRPTQALYDRYAKTHPGSFQNHVERLGPLPLDPKEKILWGEMWKTPDYGVARGDAYAAVTLSTLLTTIGKPDQVRIGSDYSFGDLKNSPAVVVGAFNNRWTLQTTANLHFYFIEDGRYRIREQGPNGRAWEKHYGKNLEPLDDTAIVARLLDSNTGQFTMIVAGIGTEGTQAASEFVTSPDLLETGLRKLPPGWQKKNVEIVLETTVTDYVPGPPRVVAVHVW